MSRNIIFSLIVTATILFIASDLHAKDYKVGNLMISDPWARASAGPVKTGAAYIGKISNHGSSMDRLIGATSPTAKRVTVHNSIIENGIAKMRHVKTMDIHPGHAASLKPGGYHIMLMGLKAPLKAGSSFPLTLEFEKAGKIEVTVDVKKIGHASKMNMDHGKMKP